MNDAIIWVFSETIVRSCSDFENNTEIYYNAVDARQAMTKRFKNIKNELIENLGAKYVECNKWTSNYWSISCNHPFHFAKYEYDISSKVIK